MSRDFFRLYFVFTKSAAVNDDERLISRGGEKLFAARAYRSFLYRDSSFHLLWLAVDWAARQTTRSIDEAIVTPSMD